jgi:hypothetical protein
MTFARLVLALALAAVALTAVTSTATAAPAPAAGTYVEGPETIVYEREVGGSLILVIERDVTMTGTYDGVARAIEHLIIRPNGDTIMHAALDFTGTACGKPAQLALVLNARGNLVEDFIGGTWTAVGRAGGDSHAGRGEFSGTAGGFGTYEGAAACG